MKKTETRPLLPLFAAGAAERSPLDFEARLRDFARAAAARGRGAPPDIERFITALRGYHRTWTVCSRTAVPVLDERAIALAVASYCEAKGARKRRAA